MLLLEQFEHLMLHPKNAVRLKELVLQLAVQGKLTESWRNQNPHVEPASELLKQIEAEKFKKIRKEKSQKPVSEEEMPYLLPEGWVWCRIGQLAIIQGGKRIPKGYSLQDIPTDHVYIRVTDMKKGTVDVSNLKYISEEVFNIIKQYTISKNDLYITIAGTIGQIGEIPDSLDGMNLTENAAKFVFDYLNKSYFKIALTSKESKTQFIGKVNQLAQPKLALHRIQSSIIPLPPLAEQEAIVARVEELMQKIEEMEKANQDRIQLQKSLGVAVLQALTTAPDDELEQQWAFLKQHFQTIFGQEANVKKLRETILQLAVQGKLTSAWRKQNPTIQTAAHLLQQIQAEKAQLVKEKKIKKEKPLEPISEDDVPYELPKSWVWCKVGDLMTNLQYGTSQKCSYDSSQNTPILRIPNVSNGCVSIDDLKYTSLTERERKQYSLEEGDLLVIRSNGSREITGTAVYIPDGYGSFGYAGYLIRIRFLISLINTQFIQRYFCSSYLRKQIEAPLRTTVGINNINSVELSNLTVPLPPLEEQEAIVAKVDQLMQLCNELEQQLTQVNQQTEALMQAVVQEALQPHEEPVLEK
ncbi:hypothetical protein TH63_13540 [Rufibacter radiotolerans]|uniref:Type I restriction modification DNA specificity domain-containing protein n=1 Tax=Rufibacter radiotolerans TaxID=1379910 RepID=A0A0H4VKU1_9BACT|nr:restriction endonuclease subunit S [Rufibacter radiotolerans]AKQ46415.1 hypothetical protein TH63_13540 [Rufibacter radiotolerans]